MYNAGTLACLNLTFIYQFFYQFLTSPGFHFLFTCPGMFTLGPLTAAGTSFLPVSLSLSSPLSRHSYSPFLSHWHQTQCQNLFTPSWFSFCLFWVWLIWCLLYCPATSSESKATADKIAGKRLNKAAQSWTTGGLFAAAGEAEQLKHSLCTGYSITIATDLQNLALEVEEGWCFLLFFFKFFF